MSTNAYIAFPIGEDKYKMVYLHSDGYAEYVLSTLNHFYTSPQKALELVSNGSMSVLGAEIGNKMDFNRRGEGKIKILGCRYHIADQCCFYTRDRGDDSEPEDNYIFTLDQILDNFVPFAYVYMYKNNLWYQL